jgi:hypothetical protein
MCVWRLWGSLACPYSCRSDKKSAIACDVAVLSVAGLQHSAACTMQCKDSWSLQSDYEAQSVVTMAFLCCSSKAPTHFVFLCIAGKPLPAHAAVVLHMRTL